MGKALLGVLAVILLLVLIIGGWTAGKYNGLVASRNNVDAKWAQVENNLQRRADLIPNLVATVQGYATQEKDVLLGVTEARSRVGSMKVDESVLNNPQAMQNFQKAQGELSSALSRLLVVSENYPQLKSDANFRELQSQLEGTENRITVARKRYTESIEGYNILTRQFPTNLTAMLFSYSVKPQFTVENEKAISVAPKVDFGAKPAPAPAPAPATK